MKELNADLQVTAQMQQREVAALGTRIFMAKNDASDDLTMLCVEIKE